MHKKFYSTILHRYVNSTCVLSILCTFQVVLLLFLASHNTSFETPGHSEYNGDNFSSVALRSKELRMIFNGYAFKAKLMAFQ